MKSKTTYDTLNTLIDKLKSSKKVYFSRFGDGDIFIMDGKSELKHNFSKELKNELVEAITIEDELYLRGVSVSYEKEEGMYEGVFEPFSYSNYLEKFLINDLGFNKDLIFESPIVFHYVSIFRPKIMIEFLNEFIRPKKKLFIGSISKHSAEGLFGEIDYYIQIPETNAYSTMDLWYPKVLENINEVELIIPTAGMATRVLNKRLWEKNIEVHSIDIGSIVDAIEGKNSRTWIKKEGNKIKNLLIK